MTASASLLRVRSLLLCARMFMRLCVMAGFVQCPGSTNDSIAWQYTSLYRSLVKGDMPPGFWIAGDAAYGCHAWLLSPFKGKNLTPQQDSFNFHLSQLRINIECAFGMLVNRFDFYSFYKMTD